MPDTTSVDEHERMDAALEPLGMAAPEPRRAHGGSEQLKLFPGPTDELAETAREFVRSRPLQAVGIALLIGVLLGR